ncbi:MAG: DUF2959 domain-containing protein [Pseudomonadales bacterium]|nr:DUF2959 domain-containing protein [Pseudomonadales bacterium]
MNPSRDVANSFSTGLLGLVLLVLVSGCSSLYYDTMEKFGIEKREILVDRVEEARESQDEARTTFRSSLARFQHVVETPDTDLKARYEELRDAFEDSQSVAEDVRSRIDSVEDVSEALFEEWQEELDRYQNANLRRASEQQLRDTRRQYATLIRRMHQAEARMEPVLEAFEDQVLFLKHNLNAQAIGALENELGRIRADVDQLIRDMEQAMAESDDFVRSLRQP